NECRLMLRVCLLALGHLWAKEILPDDVRGYASFDHRRVALSLASSMSFLRFEASLVLYPAVIMVFLAFGVAMMLRGYALS
ncbi:MAG: hypothetical protein WBA14_14740, partial [Pseudolabrys sp.]